MVAKTDTTAPGSIAEASNEPLQPGAPGESRRRRQKAEDSAGGSRNRRSGLADEAAVESPAAASSKGWAVQLAAPKSEAEAKSESARLSAKYASALNGSTIGVHKAVVNGETIYRLRVVGLSKADAAALCARLKGDGGDCFVAK